MFESKMIRVRNKRIELLNFPWDSKVLATFNQEQAVTLANEIYRIFKQPRLPETWRGKFWVVIDTERWAHHVLCENQDAAVSLMNAIGDSMESGESICVNARVRGDYTDVPSYTVIPARAVERVSMRPVEEVLSG